VKVVLKRGAMWRIRNLPGVVAAIDDAANRIAAGSSAWVMPPETHTGFGHRARVAVVAPSYEPIKRG
jgi:hypothetical protein